jgi:hypothetical protein
MELRVDPLRDGARLVDPAALDRDVHAEGAADGPGYRALAPSTMNRRQTSGSRPRSTRLSSKACTVAAFSVAPSTTSSGCLRPSASTPTAPSISRVSSMCRPQVRITGRSSPDRSEAIHSSRRAWVSALNRRDTADFDSRCFRGSLARLGGHPGLGQAHCAPHLARGHVHQHQAHRPLFQPAGLGRLLPAGQRQLLAVPATIDPLDQSLDASSFERTRGRSISTLPP